MSSVTLEDVAHRAGVSTKTVSRVINNEANVAPDTSRRVREAISELDYVPNSAARTLSMGRTTTIALVVGWSPRTAFFSMLADSLLRETLRLGYGLLLFPGGDGSARRVTKALLSKQVEGVILDSPAADDSELMEQLESIGAPHVVMHPNYPNRVKAGSTVAVDNLVGAKVATEYLLGLGHSSIGFVSFPTDRPGNERVGGYRAALEAAGIEFDESLVHEGLVPPTQIGCQGTLKLVRDHPEMTAIFAATDEIALGVFNGLWQLGLRIPEDVSVVGFDDIYLASSVAPPLTTIHQPIDDISRSAAELVVDMIENSHRRKSEVILPTALVVRDSTGSVKEQKL